MRRTSLRNAACALLLVVAVRATAAPVSTLTDVRSATLDGHTRVTLAFAGDIRFSTEQISNGIRLAFSQTRPGPAVNALRRTFPFGHVRGMVLTRLPGDSLTITLTLVEGSTYRCVCPSSGSMLYIDLQGGKPVRPALSQNTLPVSPRPQKGETSRTHTTGPPRTRKAELPVFAEHRPQGSSLVDIPALARQQVEGPEGIRGVTPAVNPVPSGEPGMPAGSRVLVSILISALSTAVVLMLLGRRLRVQPLLTPAQARASVPPAPPSESRQTVRHTAPADVEASLRPARVPVSETVVADEGEEEDYGRETSLQLARTFRRGSEEITLARTFHEQATPALTPARMETALAKATTRTQRLQAARKLGVGRGEFDLAAKLRSLQQAQVKKEEQS